VVYENGNAIGMADLKKLNIGLQAGGQAIIEVIFFETDVDLERFTEGKFEFAAETSAVALKSGIAFNAKYKDGVAVFALPKAGLMADASVGGQKFGFKAF
jgi:lipid-binding SYLF domain-containing protein